MTTSEGASDQVSIQESLTQEWQEVIQKISVLFDRTCYEFRMVREALLTRYQKKEPIARHIEVKHGTNTKTFVLQTDETSATLLFTAPFSNIRYYVVSTILPHLGMSEREFNEIDNRTPFLNGVAQILNQKYNVILEYEPNAMMVRMRYHVLGGEASGENGENTNEIPIKDFLWYLKRYDEESKGNVKIELQE